MSNTIGLNHMNEENKEKKNRKSSYAAGNKQETSFKRPWMHSLISFIVIFGVLAGFLFWQTKKNTVFY